MSNEDASPRVLTIGHSTHPIETFLGMLEVHGARCVVDVRTVPRSRHNPQFNTDALLPPGLGGLRQARRDSTNTAWRNASFRGYADYMQTPEFTHSLDELIDLARRQAVVLMCAEAVPWRCHRSLIADALLVRGIPTEHVLSATRRQAHALTPFAKVCGTSVSYPVEP